MRISVVMPVYNAEHSIAQALESLRAQTCEPAQIIVVNDGSTDSTPNILAHQHGIEWIDRPHEGIVAALNAGLSATAGDYIARMDADDLCHPERLQCQADYLDAHPEIGLVGCRVGFGGNREQKKGYATYVDWTNSLTTPDQLALNRFIESPFAHPSVMFRRELIHQFGAYRDGSFPEDYELWLRWMASGVKMAKLSKELLTWNDPPNRLSRTDPRYNMDAFYQTKADYLAQWLRENNPHHPNIVVWGAGRITRRRAHFLTKLGIHITHYIDLKTRALSCGTPVIHHTEISGPQSCFILPMVSNRGARKKIRIFLAQRGFIEGRNTIFAA